MADENLMSIIQNLFIEETNLVNHSTLDNFQNDNLINNGITSPFNTTKQQLDNDLNIKKLNLLKQLNSQNAIKQNSFFNDLPLLRSLKNEQLDNLNEPNDLFSKQIFKQNYDILNNNVISTTNHEQQTTLSPLTECSLKQTKTNNLLTPNNNFGLIGHNNNNSNNQLLLQSTQQQQNNSSIGSNLINSPTNLSHSTSTTTNSFADLILGCDDNNFNNSFGLNQTSQQQQQSQTTTNLNTVIKNAFCDASATLNSPDSFIYTEEDRFESQIRSLSNEIHSTIQLHMNGLHMRREALLQQLEHVKKIYFDVLRKKKAINGTAVTNTTTQLTKQQFEKFILPSITFNKPDSALYKAISQLGFLNTPAFGPFCTANGDGLEFAVPGANSQFLIETRNCFNDELLVGRENISIEILALFNELNENDCNKLDNYTSKSVIPHTFFDHNNGKYTVTYNLPILKITPKELIVKININALPINDSPIRVPVQTQKRQNWKLATTFGSEGNSIAKWGVTVVKMPSQLLLNYQNNLTLQTAASNELSSLTIDTSSSINSQTSSSINSAITPNTTLGLNNNSMSFTPTDKTYAEQHYLIGVADRSNNRIQLLDYNQKTQQVNVINVFGSGPGTRPGMFDRPAGICINLALNQIIVADKDNHRIQVFSLDGKYLFKFGEKGNRPGQMNYPWGIDFCGVTHRIAVSDTRNKRIQIFTPYGQYINHFSLLLDSPRGVTFLPDKRLVVSDFNKHRILIFDKLICNPNVGNPKDDLGFTNLNSPKIIGFGEGSAFGEFLRPQGLSVSGNCIYCADSRNNRICIYNMLTQTFEYLDELSLDRPSDLSVIDENLMIIIDFGNNRLQILQR